MPRYRRCTSVLYGVFLGLSGEEVHQLIRKLSEHAREIAALVLSTPGTGHRMEEDAMVGIVWNFTEFLVGPNFFY